jgi:hypothetical protein
MPGKILDFPILLEKYAYTQNALLEKKHVTSQMVYICVQIDLTSYTVKKSTKFCGYLTMNTN